MNNFYRIEVELKDGTVKVFESLSRENFYKKLTKLDKQLEKGRIRGYLGTTPNHYNPYGLLD